MASGVVRFFLLSYCLACCRAGYTSRNNLRLVRQWSELEFVFPSEQARKTAIDKGYYIPGSSFPIDVDVHYPGGGAEPRIFVTNPRFSGGRPITLGTVQRDGRIAAYPDYSWHDNQGTNCQGLTSVFRTAIDKCNRLWVLDAGKIGDDQPCPPQLVAFDLSTDKLVYRHVVTNSSYLATSLFITPVVDVRTNDCSNTFIYSADVTGFGILVLDVSKNRSWRVTNKNFYPDPDHGTFTIDGESFDFMDGILGMALSPYKIGRDRDLYFHALASTAENVVRTSVIRNDSLASNGGFIDTSSGSVYVFPNRRPNQSAAEAIDNNGIMYFGLMDPPSIWCWNTATEFSQRNFYTVAVDQEKLQFASGVKIINDPNGGQELWVLTPSFQRLATGTLNSNRVNFRIHTEKIPNILRNSPCSNTWRYGSK